MPLQKYTILIIVIIALVFVGGILGYFQIQKKRLSLRTTEYQPIDIVEGTTNILKSEAVACNGKTYIFNTIKEGNNYFTEIYEDNKSQDNLVLRSKAQRELVHEGKIYTEIKAFSILTTPKINCDRIYLTNILPISHPAPAQGIFEWKIGAREIRELAISKKFASNDLPYPLEQERIATRSVSPDGEKVIIAKQGVPTGENQYCNYKSLYLLDLHKDISMLIVQLSEAESFDDGTSDLDPYCGGLNFGWQNKSIIYFDVYNATLDWNRPFLERRTLKIE